MEQREVGVDYQRWMSKLLGYDFEIKFRLRKSNVAANALSGQNKYHENRKAWFRGRVFQVKQSKKEIEVNASLSQLKRDIEAHKGTFSRFRVDKGLLLYKGRLVLPPTFVLIPQLLFEYHNSTIGGHHGDLKTYLKIAKEWYWVGIRGQVTQYVQECDICQQQKWSHQYPAGLL